MSGLAFKIVLFGCIHAYVSGSLLVRNRRGIYYGQCGKPTNEIPHGGIDVFPVYDNADPYDKSCHNCYPICPPCEPKFYCDHGYAQRGDFKLLCVRDNVTSNYKWKGNMPKCEKVNAFDILHIGAPAISITLSVFAMAIGYAVRVYIKNRNGGSRPNQRTGTLSVSSTLRISSSAQRNGGRRFDLLTGAHSRTAGYSRFDDSDIAAPREVIPPSIGDVEATAADALPVYTEARLMEWANAGSSTSRNTDNPEDAANPEYPDRPAADAPPAYTEALLIEPANADSGTSINTDNPKDAANPEDP